MRWRIVAFTLFWLPFGAGVALAATVPSVASKAYVDTQITEKTETKVDTVPGTVQTLNGDYTVAGSFVVTGSFTVTGAFKVPTPPLPNPDAE